MEKLFFQRRRQICRRVVHRARLYSGLYAIKQSAQPGVWLLLNGAYCGSARILQPPEALQQRQRLGVKACNRLLCRLARLLRSNGSGAWVRRFAGSASPC